MTPLLAAVLSGSLDCVKILLKHGADCNIIYQQGATVLHMAAYHKKFEILRFIYTNYKTDPYLRNDDNDTAYEIAKKLGDDTMSKWVEEQDKSREYANQLLDELSHDEVAKKKSKKKKQKKKQADSNPAVESE